MIVNRGTVTAWFRGPLATVFVVVLLVQVVLNAARPMVSYRALALGADAQELGLIAASFGLLSLLGAIPAGHLIDRYGPRGFVVSSCVISSVCCAAMGAAPTIALLVIAQSILGLSQVTAAIGFQTLVAESGSQGNSEGRFGALTAVVSAGQFFGPLTAGGVSEAAVAAGLRTAPDIHATSAVFGSLALMSLVAVPVALGIKHMPHRAAASKQRFQLRELGHTLRTPGMTHALISSMVVLTTIDLLSIYLPAWGEEQAWSVGFVSALLATRAAASFTVRLLLQPLIHRFGRQSPLALGSALGALALGLIPLISAPSALFGLMTVAGLTLGLSQPMTMAWVSRTAPPHMRSTALAVRLTANRFGQSSIPIILGAVASLGGTAGIFYTLGALLLGTSAVVARSGIDDVPNSDPEPEN